LGHTSPYSSLRLSQSELTSFPYSVKLFGRDGFDKLAMRFKLARKSRAEPLERSAKSSSAALLIWHGTICFLIVNLNTIKSASYPTASPRVSNMNPVLFQWPVEADREVDPPAF
jgi:hypothetical protein